MEKNSRQQDEQYWAKELKNALSGNRVSVMGLLNQFLLSAKNNEEHCRAVNIFVSGAINRILSGVEPADAFRLTKPSHRPTEPEEKHWSYVAAVLFHEQTDELSRPDAKDKVAMIMEIDIRTIEKALKKYEKKLSYLSLNELEALI